MERLHVKISVKDLLNLLNYLGQEDAERLVDKNNGRAVKDFCKTLAPIKPNGHNLLPTEMKIGRRIYEIITFLKEDEDAISGHEVIRRAKELNAVVEVEDIDYVLELKECLPEIFMKYCLIFVDGVDEKNINYLNPRIGNTFHQYYLTWDKESKLLEENCWGSDNFKDGDLFFKKNALLLRRKS